MMRDDLLRLARGVVSGSRPVPLPFCLEHDGATCGANAEVVVDDVITNTVSPRCRACARYYASDIVHDMTESVRREIGLKQLLNAVLEAT